MVDFVLGVYFTGLFVRGWLRGFVKEAMDLIGLIVGRVRCLSLQPVTR